MGLRIDMFTGTMEKVLANGKKIITQKAGGKTITNVLNEDGNILTARIKEIKHYDVGNKKVITRTDAMAEKKDYMYMDYADYKYSKMVIDRVFNNEGKYLGARRFFSSPQYPSKVAQKVEPDRKVLEIGNIGSATCIRDNGTRLERYYYGNNEMLRYNAVNFDSKGLPIKHNANTCGLDSLI